MNNIILAAILAVIQTASFVIRAQDYSPDTDPCYGQDKAYLTGVMNIREGATTASGIVGKTKAGYIYDVESVYQGDTYCWLEVAEGWIADTLFVTSDKPPLPEVTGEEEWLRGEITKSLKWLRDNSAEWYNYVMGTEQEFCAERPALRWPMRAMKSWTLDATAWAITELDVTCFWGYNNRDVTIHNPDPKELYFASVLVHESCHHYQFDEGKFDNMSVRNREIECYIMQREMLRDFPRNRLLKRWVEKLSINPPRT